MKKTVIYSVTSSILILCTGSALAIPITGEISFDGTITFNSGLGTATTITSFDNARVSSDTQMGSYATVPNSTAVTFSQPINFVSFSGPLADLWKFTDSGRNYAFDLNTLAVVFQNSGFLNLSGQGVARITGFDNTPGIWRLTAQQGSQHFSFSASSAIPTSVPDGGSTLILLGLGGLAIGAFRNRLSHN